MSANVLPNSRMSWLSLISEASETDESVPSEPLPCHGGLSCELTPYSSLRVRLTETNVETLRRGLFREFGASPEEWAMADSVDIGTGPTVTRASQPARKRPTRRAA
jgi:hypothetical protein